MMRKTLLEKAGMIREEYDGAQDYDLFLRCVECAEAIGHVRGCSTTGAAIRSRRRKTRFPSSMRWMRDGARSRII